MWEYQVPDLVAAGYQVITYDRRGFGDSSRPWDGYDYDTLAADLDAVLAETNAKNATLVGFSMGGGEVARYLAKHGSERVSSAVFMSSVTPYLFQSKESPAGAPAKMMEEFQVAMLHDRVGFLKQFGKTFFGLSAGQKVLEMITDDASELPSDALLDYFLQVETFASPQATRECAKAFGTTDFTADIERIDMPVMVLHGDNDKVVPFEATGMRTAGIIKQSRIEIVNGGPHGIWYTHRKEVNGLLIDFLSSTK